MNLLPSLQVLLSVAADNAIVERVNVYDCVACRSGSVIASFRFIFDFGSNNNNQIDNSLLIRATLSDGIKNTPNLLPMQRLTATVNGTRYCYSA